MATFADLFTTCYLTGASGVDFPSVRLHYRGADRICRAFGATALAVGSDIYFRDGAFAPYTPDGLRILAHEVAHVVQQRRGPVAARQIAGGLAVAPAGSADEREADAAAGALLSGRPFAFARAGAPSAAAPGTRVIQRYMAWEHCMLGDLDPAQVHPEQLEAHCALLERLGRDPRNIDEERLQAELPGLETLRLPGSGLVVTLGELNVLPDYLAHPAEIETAPEAFLLPLIQSIRSLNITELRRSAGRPGRRPRLQGSLKYPRLRGLAEIGEVLEVDALGRRCGFAPWKLYSSAVGRNAGHFAPFSWHRWRSYHLMARDLIARSLAATGDDREKLRTRARIYAGYADHFLQDSNAAGHLVNKTLVMQWYVEWLADARVPCLDRHVLARMTTSRQPFHGQARYRRAMACARGPVRRVRGLERMLVHVLAHRSALPRQAARRQQGRPQTARGVRAAAGPARLRRRSGGRMVRAGPAGRTGLAGTRPVPRAGGRPAGLVGPLLLRPVFAPRPGRHRRPDRGGPAGGGLGGCPGARGLSGRHDRAVSYRQPVPRDRDGLRPARLPGRGPAQAGPSGDAQGPRTGLTRRRRWRVSGPSGDVSEISVNCQGGAAA